jgi:hypothetical protein
MGAVCNAVKSPPRMARTRAVLESGLTLETRPRTTVPAGTTWWSKLYTGSRTLASTGEPSRFGTRRVRYRRSGTPAGTTIGTC